MQKLAEHQAAADDKQRLLSQQQADEVVQLKLEHQSTVASRLKEAAASHSEAVAAIMAKHKSQLNSVSGQLLLQKESSEAELASSSAQLASVQQQTSELKQKHNELQQQHHVLLAAHDAAVQSSESLLRSHEAHLAQLQIENR